MRRIGGEAGIALWFLVAAFVALMMGRARAEPAPQPAAPVVASMAPSPETAAPSAPLAVDVAAKAFRGQVLFSDVMIAPASAFPSGDAMVTALQRLKRSSVEGTGGFWRLHVVAFPSPVPTGGTYRLLATDTTEGQPHKQVKEFQIGGQPGQAELEISDLVLTDVMGFQRGHRYELQVVSEGADEGAAGKADVCAKGVITLM
jgi:hypothetical protein